MKSMNSKGRRGLRGLCLSLVTLVVMAWVLVGGEKPSLAYPITGISALASGNYNSSTSNNLLPLDDSNIEAGTGGLSIWSAQAGKATGVRDTTPGAAYEGSAAYKVTNTYSGAQQINIYSTPSLVTAGGYMDFSAQLKSPNNRTMSVALQYLDQNYNIVGGPCTSGTTVSSAYVTMSAACYAPSSAVWAQGYVVAQASATNDTFYVDALQMVFGSTTTTFVPGYITNTVNLLDPTQADAEATAAGLGVPWGSGGSSQATVSRDNGSNPSAWRGNWSWRLTSTYGGAQSTCWNTLGYNIPVTAGSDYTLSAYVNGTGASGRTAIVKINWMSNSTTKIDQSASATVTLTSSYQRLIATGTAPTGATSAYMDICFNATASGQYINLDGLQFEKGSSASTWQPAGSVWAGGGPYNYAYYSSTPWHHPNYYGIRRAHVRFQGRPYNNGSPDTYDQMQFYYRTCNSCSWQLLNTYSIPWGTSTGYLDLQIDLSSILPTEIKPQVYTGSSNVAGNYQAIAWVIDADVEGPPFTPGNLSIGGTAPAQGQITLNWTANNNPAGAWMELWRKTLNSDGSTASDEMIMQAPRSITSFSTGSISAPQSPGNWYTYRLRARSGAARNLLQPTQANAEDVPTGALSAWQSSGSPTVVADTTTYHTGTQSYYTTAVSSGGLSINTGASRTYVTGGGNYSASVYTRAALARQGCLTIWWYDSGGATISSNTGTCITESTSWQRVTVSATAPANAVTAILDLGMNSTVPGDKLWWDDAQLEPNATASAYLDPGTSGNLLTPDQASAETSVNGLGFWTPGGGGALVRDTSTRMYGTASARGTATLAGNFSINTGNFRTAVPASQPLTFSVYAKASTTSRTWLATIYYYDASGTYTGSSCASPISVTATSFTQLSVSCTSPSDAASVYVDLSLLAGQPGDSLWWSAGQLEIGSSASAFTVPPMYSGFTSEVAYWVPPVPAVTETAGGLAVNWTNVRANQVVNTSGISASTSCGGYYASSWYYPTQNATRVRVSFTGYSNDIYYIYSYSPSYGYQNTWVNPVGATTDDRWVTLPYPASQFMIYINNPSCGHTATATITQAELLSPTGVTVQYSANGSSWTNWTTNATNSTTITSQSPVSPSTKYQVRLVQTNLPNGGPSAYESDGAWYSPLWNPFQYVRFTGQTQTSTVVTWLYTNSIATNAPIRIRRNGVTVWEGVGSPTNQYDSGLGGYYYQASFTDTGLAAGTWYSYDVCALNATLNCTYLNAATTTTPATPDRAGMAFQYGSNGWATSNANNAWTEITWGTAQGATGYKVYVNGTATSVGNQLYARLTLNSGTAYSITVSAVNGAGESPQSSTITFTTPDRADSAGPTNGSALINEGAAVTGGARVKIRGTASDGIKSGVAGLQVSNDGNTWSTTTLFRSFQTDNLVNAAGGDAFFSSLAGWVPDPGIWASIVADPAANAGGAKGTGTKVVLKNGSYTQGTYVQLSLPSKLPVTAGQTYTFTVRYRTTGLTAGNAVVYGQSLNGSGAVINNVDRLLVTNASWQTVTWQETAPTGATKRSFGFGFAQADAGAVLEVDFVMINEGPVAATPDNQLTDTISGTVDWTLDVSGGFGAKTTKVRFVDYAGNTSTAVSATIQYMLTDTAAPRVTLTINGGSGTTSSTQVSLQISATDDLTGPELLQMRVSNDGSAWSSWQAYKPTLTWTICTGLTPALCEGQRTVWVEVQDTATNVGGATAMAFFRQDTTPVVDATVVWATTGSSGAYDTGTGTVTVQFQRLTQATIQLDPAKLSGVVTIRYGFDPNRYGQWESLKATKTINLPNVQGIQTLYIQADNGQQWSLNFLLDYTAPTVDVSWSGGATITKAGGKATLVVDASDNLSRNEDLQVSVNGGAWQAWSPTMDVTLSGSGLKSVSIRVKDPAGNVTTKNLSIFAVP